MIIVIVLVTLIVIIVARQFISKKYHVVTSNHEENETTLNEYKRTGDETEVFLKYIIDNYEKLPKLIKFTNSQRENSIETEPKKIYSNYYFYSHSLGYDTNHINIFPRDELGFTNWFKKYVCQVHHIEEYIHVTSSPFIVRTPLKKPKSYYENVYKSLKNSAEVKYYVKKSWIYILSN